MQYRQWQFVSFHIFDPISLGRDCYEIIFALANGLASNRRRAIVKNNDEPFEQPRYEALIGDELNVAKSGVPTVDN